MTQTKKARKANVMVIKEMSIEEVINYINEMMDAAPGEDAALMRSIRKSCIIFNGTESS